MKFSYIEQSGMGLRYDILSPSGRVVCIAHNDSDAAMIVAALEGGCMKKTADELPESGKRVIFGWKNGHGKWRTSIGFYAAHEDIVQGDEDEESRWLDEGWYEIEAEGDFIESTPPAVYWVELPNWEDA